VPPALLLVSWGRRPTTRHSRDRGRDKTNTLGNRTRSRTQERHKEKSMRDALALMELKIITTNLDDDTPTETPLAEISHPEPPLETPSWSRRAQKPSDRLFISDQSPRIALKCSKRNCRCRPFWVFHNSFANSPSSPGDEVLLPQERYTSDPGTSILYSIGWGAWNHPFSLASLS
jgi:hypothetical protein